MPPLQDLSRAAWLIAEEKGFHEGRGPGRDDTLLRLCLVHTEVSEAAQVVKRQGTDSLEALNALEEELADVLIRVFDLAHVLSLDLDYAVAAKMKKNRSRPRLYGTPAAPTHHVEETA